MGLFVLFNIYFPNLNIFNQGILYSSENNIDCKLLMTKTKEQKSGKKNNIGIIYIIHCALSLLMVKIPYSRSGL